MRMHYTHRERHANENGRVLVNELLGCPDWDWAVRFVVPKYHRRELAEAARVLGAPFALEREGRRMLIERLRGRFAEVAEVKNGAD